MFLPVLDSHLDSSAKLGSNNFPRLKLSIMELYEAIADFKAEFPDVNSRVLTVTQGERFEVLEINNETRHHQEWWGVRNLINGQLGYVPARYLKVSIYRV